MRSGSSMMSVFDIGEHGVKGVVTRCTGSEDHVGLLLGFKRFRRYRPAERQRPRLAARTMLTE